MRFRKLRIAWSVVCGIVCLLLIVLWVRSYWWYDAEVLRLRGDHVIQIDSKQGGVRFLTFPRVFGTILAKGHSSRWVGYEPLSTDQAMLDFGREKVAYGPNENWWAYQAPHWFVALLSATLAAAPWIPYCFSLRTLLIATTLVAVLLGAVIYAVR
jgi:hypothetical protein